MALSHLPDVVPGPRALSLLISKECTGLKSLTSSSRQVFPSPIQKEEEINNFSPGMISQSSLIQMFMRTCLLVRDELGRARQG